jgi:hypothetical protein
MSAVQLVVALVVGPLIGFLLKPLITALGLSGVLDEMLGGLFQEIVLIGIGLVIAVLLSKAERVERFLDRHITVTAILLGIATAASLALSAPARVWPVIFADIILVVLLVCFCGFLIRTAMFGVGDDQKAEQRAAREEEARRIAEEGVATGDIDAAIGRFGLDAAGGCGALAQWLAALIAGTLGIVIAAAVCAFVTARRLYAIGAAEALVYGVVFGVLTFALVALAIKAGDVLSPQIPYFRKHRPILPDA